MLLPGVREVRAPLAAGFLWLAALWFLFEPQWSETTSVGVVASTQHLMDALSIVGQGAALSFCAYILGSISIFSFSRPLRSLIKTTYEPRAHRLDGLSAESRESLNQVAIDGRQLLERALALSGTGVDELLRIRAPSGPSKAVPALVIHQRRWWQQWRRLRWLRRQPRILPGLGMHHDESQMTAEQRQEREFGRALPRRPLWRRRQSTARPASRGVRRR